MVRGRFVGGFSFTESIRVYSLVINFMAGKETCCNEATNFSLSLFPHVLPIKSNHLPFSSSVNMKIFLLQKGREECICGYS
jgi:hypothetical protein